MDKQTLESIAELICGDDENTSPIYRSGTQLTRFFEAADLSYLQHDGSTRKWWTLRALEFCSPEELRKVISRLASPREYRGDRDKTRMAIQRLNEILQLEGLKVELRDAQPLLIETPINFDLGSDEHEEFQRELKPLPPPDFDALGLETALAPLLKERWGEANKCINAGAHLMAIVAMGGLLEGLLLATLLRFPENSNRSLGSPKDVTGKVKAFYDWTLSEMIDVAHSENWIDLDVKKFSHALRDFRNLIHPYQQMVTGANPDEDTCKISWLVVQAAVNDLAKILTRS